MLQYTHSSRIFGRFLILSSMGHSLFAAARIGCLLFALVLFCVPKDVDAYIENFDAPLDSSWTVLNVDASVSNGKLVTTNSVPFSWDNALNQVYRDVSIQGDFTISTSCDYVEASSDISKLLLFLTFADGNTAFVGMGDPWSGNSGGWTASSSSGGSDYHSGKGSVPASGSFVASISRVGNQLSFLLNGNQVLLSSNSSELVKVGLTHTKYENYNVKTANWDYLEIIESAGGLEVLSISPQSPTNTNVADFFIGFTEPLEPTSARDVSNYSLTLMETPDGGTPSTNIPLFPSYDGTGNSVNLIPSAGNALNLAGWHLWDAEANAGNWTLSPDQLSLNQSINAAPTFYLSPDQYQEQVLQFKMAVATTSDDDWIGFIFGSDHTDSDADTFYLFAWKQASQNHASFGGDAHEGIQLIQFSNLNTPDPSIPFTKDQIIEGITSASRGSPKVWTTLISQSQGSGTGWADNKEYICRLTLGNASNPTSIEIIDATTEVVFWSWSSAILDSSGKIGFFNYSQENVNYQIAFDQVDLVDGRYRFDLQSGVGSGIQSASGGALQLPLSHDYYIDRTAPVFESSASANSAIHLTFADLLPLQLENALPIAGLTITASGADGTFADNNEVDVTSNLDSVELLEDERTVALHFSSLVSDHYQIDLTDSAAILDAAGNEVDLAAFPIVHQHNNPPVVVPLTEVFYEAVTTDFSVSATDVDGDPVSMVVLNIPTGMVDNGDGSFTWTPTEDQGGQSFSLEVSFSDDGTPAQMVTHTYDLQVLEVVEFAETAIWDAVVAALGKPLGTIVTEQELADLTGTLVLSGQEIQDLSGLEYATSLEVLDLSNNQIHDLTPIANLTGLTSLNLDGNFLDVTAGSEDRLILDTFASVTYDLQSRFNLNVSLSDAAAGTITISPDISTYAYGDVVTLSFQKNAGYEFLKWSGDVLEYASMFDLTIEGQTTVQANANPIGIPTSGLLCFFSADEKVTVDTGVVNAWMDRNSDLKAISGGGNITAGSDSFGNYLNFDGSSNTWLNVTLPESAKTVIYVFRPEAMPFHYWSAVFGSSDDARFGTLLDHSTDDFHKSSGNSGYYPDAVWHNGEALDAPFPLGYDVRAEITTIETNQHVPSNHKYRIGSLAANYPIKGDIYAVLVYNRKLNESDRLEVEKYLANKYHVYAEEATWLDSYNDLSFKNEVISKNRFNKNEADAAYAIKQSEGLSNTFFEGLSAYFSADQGIVETAGKVTSWGDRISDREATSVGNILKSSDLNGDFLRFDGSSNTWLDVTLPDDVKTVIYVFRPEAMPFHNWSAVFGSSDDARFGTLLDHSTDDFHKSFSNSGYYPDAVWHNGEALDAPFSLGYDVRAEITTIETNQHVPSNHKYRIGSLAASYPIKGDIYAILTYNRKLNIFDRIEIERHLALNYGIEYLGEILYFADSEMEAALRALDEIPDTGNIMIDDLVSLTGTLDLSGRSITSLDGLQYATGITGLDLSNNAISDLSPIAGLTQLTSLLLSGNRIDLDAADDAAILAGFPDTTVINADSQARFTISVSTVGGGSYSLNPQQSDYGYGASVAITALPDGDDLFIGWTGDVSATVSPYAVTVNNSISATATFIDGVLGSGDGLLVDAYRFPSSPRPAIEDSFTGVGDRARLDQVDFTSMPLLPEGQSDYVSYWVYGQLQARYTDTYTFYLTRDDEAQLYLNDILVYDVTCCGEVSSYSIDLVAGEKYDIKILYRDFTESNSLKLKWSTPNVAKEVVPQGQLYSPLESNPLVTPDFASPVTVTYTDADGNALDPFPAFGVGPLSIGDKVALAVADPTDTIRYTLDGSVPTAASPVYSSSIPIDANVTLTAQAFNASKHPGAPFIGVYEIDATAPVLSNPELPYDSNSGRFTIAFGDASQTISILAEDNNAIASVAFTLIGGTPSQAFFLGFDSTGVDAGSTGTYDQYRFSAPFDIFNFEDGAWSLRVEATDSVGNVTSTDFDITIAITAPDAPVITSPADAANFSDGQILVIGTAREDSTVSLQIQTADLDGSNVSAWASVGSTYTVNANGEFNAPLSLDSGKRYDIRAFATSRSNDISASSAPVSFVVDSSRPASPTNLHVAALAGGEIQISWSPEPGYSGVITGYRIQRKTAASTWTDVADVAGNVYSYTFDSGALSGPYSFRVLAIRALSGGTEQQFSIESEAPVSAPITADAVAPTVIALSHAPTEAGQYDSTNNKYGSGFVDISLELIEPVNGTPYLAFKPTAGIPVRVPLIAINDTRFEGTLTIDENVPSGDYSAYLLVRDLAGNVSETGTSNEPYETSPLPDAIADSFAIDSEGPVLVSVDPSDRSVFKNDETATLKYEFSFDEDLLPNSDITPTAEWGDEAANAPTIVRNDLGSGNYEVIISFASGDGYEGTAPNSDPAIDQQNLDDAMLYITIEATDTLGNVGLTEIPGVLIYRGQLPRPAPPVLIGEALAGGDAKLTWSDVDDADQYQLYYRESPAGEWLELDDPVVRSDGSPYEFIYTSADGTYEFYVTGERSDSDAAGGYVHGFESDVVEITSDQTPPPAVDSVTADEVPNSSVIKITWNEPDSTEHIDIAHYDVYRCTSLPTDVTQLQENQRIQAKILPVLAGGELHVYDSQPIADLAFYTVVAVDSVGNATLATEIPSRNIALVPPSSVTVTSVDGQQPVLSWAAVSAAETYSLYYLAIDGTTLVPLASGLTALTFTDTSWFSDARTYIIESVQATLTASRDVLFPGHSFELTADTVVYRGLPARLQIERAATADASWDHFSRRLSVALAPSPIDTDFSQSALNADYVDFGLALDTSATPPTEQGLVFRLTLKASDAQSLGESVVYEIERTLPIEERVPYLSLTAAEFARGATAQDIELTIGNPSESAIKLLLDDPTTPTILLKLLDAEGNLLAQEIVTSSNRTVDGAGSVTLKSLTFDVPANAPASVILQAELYGYEVPETSQDFDLGDAPITTRLSVSTSLLSYKAVLTGFTIDSTDYLQSATDVKTSGNAPLIIKGKALKLDGLTPSAATTVIFGIENGAYKRTYALITDSDGNFSYSFLPTGNEPGGTYTVWAKHPALTNTPEDSSKVGSFFYQRIIATPEYYTIRIPRNHNQVVPIKLAWPEGLALTDLSITALDFQGTTLDPSALGISLTLPSPVADPNANSNYNYTLEPVVKGVLPAPTDLAGNSINEASFLFKVTAKVDGILTTIAEVPAYCYFAEAFGQLRGPSKLIELGVLHDTTAGTFQEDSASLTFTNTGLIPLTGLSFEVLQPIFDTVDPDKVVGYQPAPDWAKLMVPSIDSLDLNESIDLQFETRFAQAAQADGTYRLEVIARSNEAPLSRAQLSAKVTTDADSSFEVHVVNIFFGYDASTVAADTSDIVVPAEYANGIVGATVTLQRDDVAGTTWSVPQIFTGKTQLNSAKVKFGEAGDPPLPPGRYQVKVTAPKHEPYYGSIWIKPGVDHFDQIALNYGAVTVEWEVKEITIEDRYEVKVETTFETKVPAPVLLITPAAIALPAMCPGDVYEVELLLENKGILAAQDFENPTPQSDEFLRVEPITMLPDSFDVPARETIRVAYRYICLKALPNSECAE